MACMRKLGGLLSLIVAVPFCVNSAQSSQELVFLTWADYMDPALIERFERFEHEHDVSVRMVYFEGDDHRNDLLIGSDATRYDVIMLNDIEIANYRQRGWLASLAEQEVPTLRHVDPRWHRAYPAAEGYAVPVLWGTFGIGYREDLVSEPIESWMQLFEPQDALRGRWS